MTLRTTKVGPFVLGVGGLYQTLDTGIVIELQELKNLQIQAVIDNGADDVVPTGTPVGSWRLHCSGQDDAKPARITAAETGSMSLADIAPNGNNLVDAYANFTDTPGARARLYYVRSSGTARCTLYITVS